MMRFLFIISSLVLVFGTPERIARAPTTNVIFFLVAEREDYRSHNDSFVLPLNRSEDIDHARRLIRDPYLQDRPIVAAKVALGSNGINRDYLRADKREWSWHITQFSVFTDGVPGTPQSTSPHMIESAPDTWWTAYGSMSVFFPFYRVVQELGPNPLWVISEKHDAEITLRWANLGETFAYVIESAPSLDGPWETVSSLGSPVTATNASLPMPADNRFFRVRAISR